MLRRRPIIVDGIKLHRAEAAAVYKAAYAAARRPRRLLGWLMIAALCSPVIGLWWLTGGPGFATSAQGGPFAIALVLLLGAFSGVYFGLCINLGSRWFYRREIREAMLELGYRLCADCGYWLKGHDDTALKCPECGERLEVS